MTGKSLASLLLHHQVSSLKRSTSAFGCLSLSLLLLESLPLLWSLGSQRESMETIGLGHLFLEQLVYHSVSDGSALALKLVADNGQSKVRLDSVVRSPHGSMVSVLVRVVVDLEKDRGELLLDPGVDGIGDGRVGRGHVAE